MSITTQNRAEVKPTPADDFKIGDISLPKLIDGHSLVFELTCPLDHNESRAGDQVMGY